MINETKNTSQSNEIKDLKNLMSELKGESIEPEKKTSEQFFKEKKERAILEKKLLKQESEVQSKSNIEHIKLNSIDELSLTNTTNKYFLFFFFLVFLGLMVMYFIEDREAKYSQGIKKATTITKEIKQQDSASTIPGMFKTKTSPTTDTISPEKHPKQ